MPFPVTNNSACTVIALGKMAKEVERHSRITSIATWMNISTIYPYISLKCNKTQVIPLYDNTNDWEYFMSNSN